MLFTQRKKVLGYNLIGCGNRSKFFHKRLKELRCEIVSVYDLCQKKAEHYRQHGAAICNSLETALAVPSDFVVICTTAHNNATCISKTMDLGKHILAEKPMGQSSEDVKILLDAKKNYKGVLQISNQENADARYNLASQIIETQVIGQPCWINASWCRNNEAMDWKHEIDQTLTSSEIDWGNIDSTQPFNVEQYYRWRNFWKFSGGLLTDSMYHKLAPLMSVFPQKPIRLSCSGSGQEPNREVPNNVFATINYPQFSMLLLGSNKSSFEQPDMIRGDRGTIIFEQDSAWTVPSPKSLVVRKEPRYGGGETRYDAADSGPDVFENFTNVLRGIERNLCSGFEPHIRASVLSAMLVECLRENKVIEVKQWLDQKQLTVW